MSMSRSVAQQASQHGRSVACQGRSFVRRSAHLPDVTGLDAVTAGAVGVAQRRSSSAT